MLSLLVGLEVVEGAPEAVDVVKDALEGVEVVGDAHGCMIWIGLSSRAGVLSVFVIFVCLSSSSSSD